MSNQFKKTMDLSELFYLLKWDCKVNRGWSWDRIRAVLLLFEIRIEQYIHRNFHRPGKPCSMVWYACRFLGSLYQWLLCNSNIPGTIKIGRGLRLPHPQNIILAGYAEIGEFCTIYHNVSIAWNGFFPIKPNSPAIGDRVLIGTGVIILGDIAIGSHVLIGAGAVVTHSVPPYSRVTNPQVEIRAIRTSDQAALIGSERHLDDPYSIWR